MSDSQPRASVCHVCEASVTIDGSEAVERFGEVLCRDCSDEPVILRAECINQFCDWTFEKEGTEFDRGHVEQLVRSEVNSHEQRKRVFADDPMHETTVEEVRTDG